MANAAPFDHARSPPRKDSKNDGVQKLIKQRSGIEPKVQPQRIGRQPQTIDAQNFRVFHQDAENRRVQMHVQMAIHMIERQATGSKTGELLMDLGAQLFLESPTKKIGTARAKWAIGKFA